MMRSEVKPKGQVIILIGLALVLLSSLAGLAVDAIYFYSVKVRLVTAVDATALGIARALGRGVTSSDQNNEVVRTANLLFSSNFPQNTMLTGSTPRIATGPFIAGPNVTAGGVFVNDANVPQGMREVRLTGEVQVPTFFFRVFGKDSLTMQASATAARRDVNVMLVLDRSASMANAGAWVPLQNAAVFFLNQFDNVTDRLGIVTYGSSAAVDLALNTGFKTGDVGKNAIMGQVVPASAGTNTPLGLWMGYAELLAANDPDALNAIVFFTDGNPTVYSASFPVRIAPPGSGGRPWCNSSPMEASIATTGNNEADVSDILLFSHLWAPYPAVISGYNHDYYTVHSGSPTNIGARLCRNLADNWYHASSNVEELFAPGSCLPQQWTPTYLNPTARAFNTETTTHGSNYGVNACDAALKSTTSSNATRGRHVHRTAKTISANIASDARTNVGLGGVIIYSIGLGNIDADFLQRIANDPASASYVNGQPEGLFVAAPTPAQLQQAFQTVANEIFRLIK